MIKIKRYLTVWWPVTIAVPADGGQTETHRAEFLLRVPRDSDRRKMFNRYDNNTGAVTADVNAQMTDDLRAFLTDHVEDWREIVDDDGQPIAFSAEALADSLDALPALTPALATALGEISLGKPATPADNT